MAIRRTLPDMAQTSESIAGTDMTPMCCCRAHAAHEAGAPILQTGRFTS